MAGLDFEKPIVELEKKIQDLQHFISDKRIDLSSELDRLGDKLEHLKKILTLIFLPGKECNLHGTRKGPTP